MRERGRLTCRARLSSLIDRTRMTRPWGAGRCRGTGSSCSTMEKVAAAHVQSVAGRAGLGHPSPSVSPPVMPGAGRGGASGQASVTRPPGGRKGEQPNRTALFAKYAWISPSRTVARAQYRKFSFADPQRHCLLCCGWWLKLICCERKILLAGWWLLASTGLV